MRFGHHAAFAASLVGVFLWANFALAGASTRIINFPSGFGSTNPTGLTAGTDGKFFGTTAKGGTKNAGGVFEIDAPPPGSQQWAGHTIYGFTGGKDGTTPSSPPLIVNGTIYGTTTAGGGTDCKWVGIWGTVGCGTVFSLTPNGGGWTKKTIWQFSQTDGGMPTGQLIADSKGALYGTTRYGGIGSCMNGKYIAGCGVVFKLTPPLTAKGQWKLTVLHHFGGGVSPSVPAGGVVADSKGNLYGTAADGAYPDCLPVGGCGFVFMLKPPAKPGTPWEESIVWRFKDEKDGAGPYGALIIEPNGALIGTTLEGGDGVNAIAICSLMHCGTVFRLNPPATPGAEWTEDILHAFTGGKDGAAPQGTLVQDAAGGLYGTAIYGGDMTCGITGCGVAFALRPESGGKSWKETTLYTFSAAVGYQPSQNIVVEKSGKLLGTGTGGTQYSGILFEISGSGYRR